MTLTELLLKTGTAPLDSFIITLAVCWACGWTGVLGRPASTALIRCPLCWHWRVT